MRVIDGQVVGKERLGGAPSVETSAAPHLIAFHSAQSSWTVRRGPCLGSAHLSHAIALVFGRYGRTSHPDFSGQAKRSSRGCVK